MKKLETTILVFYQAAGYMWHFVVYIILLPFFLIMLSEGLDFILMDRLFNGYKLPQLNGLPVYQLSVLVIGSLGLLILVESIMALYKEAHAFPFSMLPHKSLSPTKLAKSGWYARVRHPMLLGYLVILVAVGLYLQLITMVFWWIPLLGGLMVEYSVLTEEKQLHAWFGKEYDEYRKRVPAIIPRWGSDSSANKKTK